MAFWLRYGLGYVSALVCSYVVAIIASLFLGSAQPILIQLFFVFGATVLVMLGLKKFWNAYTNEASHFALVGWATLAVIFAIAVIFGMVWGGITTPLEAISLVFPVVFLASGVFVRKWVRLHDV